MTRLGVYRAFRRPSVDAAVVMLCLLLLAGESRAQSSDYARVFVDRVVPADPPQTVHPTLAAYVRFMDGFATNEQWQADLEALYAPELYFSDTLVTARQRSVLERHFAALKSSGTEIDLRVHDVLQGEQGTYLVWSGVNRFSILGDRNTVDSIGVTLFRLDPTGRIIYQQDFWDPAKGFYEHVPVLGAALRVVRNQFNPE